MASFEQWACSSLEINKSNYEWQVKNFSLRSSTVGAMLSSPTFYSGTGSQRQKWRIDIFWGGLSEENNDYISIFLRHMYPNRHTTLNIECEFSVVNPKNGRKFCNFFMSQNSKEFKKNSLGTETFLLLSAIRKNRDEYLLDDTLTIRCDLEVQANKSYFSRLDHFSTQAASKVAQHHLGVHLKPFLNATTYSDVTIISGDEKFLAHKVILSAQSTVFSAMFDESTTEKQTKEVEINDLPPNVVKGMLHYMYTDDIPKNCSARDLLVAADMYELEGLKASSILALLRIFNEYTAAEILSIAHLHKAEDLKMYAIDYIASHEMEVGKTDGFKQLMTTHPSLLVEIYKARLKTSISQEVSLEKN